MNTLLAWCFASLFTLIPTALIAESRRGHDAFHEFYSHLRSPEGESCCNEKDCRPVEGRFVPEGRTFTLEILIGARWKVSCRRSVRPAPGAPQTELRTSCTKHGIRLSRANV